MSEIVRRVSSFLGEQYDLIHHDTGLDIYVFPKKRSTCYAAFLTRYGSTDNTFSAGEPGRVITVPDGIAHFLEHKMFEEEDGSDAFEKFAALGADANAFTGPQMTEYVFSCTDNFENSLGVLLDMVTHPHFTAESVEKEKKIIEQEIRMGEDDSGEVLYYGLLRSLYHHSHMRIPIAGTVESIQQITPELLGECYKTFYNLHNMALFICGDVTTDRVLSVADSRLKKAEDVKITRYEPEEPETIASKFFYREMEIDIPSFAIGVKDRVIPDDAVARLRRSAVMEILNMILFSRSSEWINDMIGKNLLASDYTYGYSCCREYAYNEFTGDSDAPAALYEEYLKYIRSMQKTGVAEEDFERMKKVSYANSIAFYDSVTATTDELIDFVLDGAELFDEPEVISSVTIGEVNTALREILAEDKTVLAVTAPLGSDSLPEEMRREAYNS